MTLTAKQAKDITKEAKKTRNNFPETDDFTTHIIEIDNKIKNKAILGNYWADIDFEKDFIDIKNKLMVKRTLTVEEIKCVVSYFVDKGYKVSQDVGAFRSKIAIYWE